MSSRGGVPVGAGHGGALKLIGRASDRVLTQGPRAVLAAHGVGTDEDIEHAESQDACPKRPRAGIGSVPAFAVVITGHAGSGSHFLELSN